MSIVIFGDLFTFPEGNAATNRVYTYAKGFLEQGTPVFVICFENEYLKDYNGVIDGIYYYHPLERRCRSRFFIIRNWYKLLKFYNSVRLIRTIDKQDKITAINVWTDFFTTHVFAWFLKTISRSKLIVERSEHPLAFFQKNQWIGALGLLKFKIETRLSDGILCISKYLIEFHLNQGIDRGKLLLVPSTVDPTRFVNTGQRPFPTFYVGYFGGLTFDRDNIHILIEAFAKISKSQPDVHLILGGFCSDPERKRIFNLLEQLGISSRIIVLEYLTRAEIVNYIGHADILVMMRGNDLKSMASFPSKLTEYLSTGKPVVTVDVGEIREYLTDCENAFIVPPEDAGQLGEKLDFIIKNYSIAEVVAGNGRALTQGVFHYSFQARRIINYISGMSRSSPAVKHSKNY